MDISGQLSQVKESGEMLSEGDLMLGWPWTPKKLEASKPRVSVEDPKVVEETAFAGLDNEDDTEQLGGDSDEDFEIFEEDEHLGEASGSSTTTFEEQGIVTWSSILPST